MDKETLSNYGWIAIVTLVLAVMLALATPFGKYVGNGAVNIARGYVNTSNKQMDKDNIDSLGDEWEGKLENGISGSESESTGIKRNGTIPEGATYYKGGQLCSYCNEVYGVSGMKHGPMCDSSSTFDGAPAPTATYTSGQTFPTSVEEGDIYIENDFRYCYFTSDGGWRVSVMENKSSYNGTILSEVAGKPVTSMRFGFSYCNSLTTAPRIPSSVTDMCGTFNYCRNLTSATIPSNVTNLTNTFSSCSALTTVEINTNPLNWSGCLGNSGVTTITGSCTQATKEALLATK